LQIETKVEKIMKEKDLLKRTKQFALNILKLSKYIPDTPEGKVIKYQLVKAGTSTAANYRAACKGRSKAEFVAKLGVVEEEADESAFWLEMLAEGEILKNNKVESLLKEANEIVAIMASSKKTASKYKTRS
jgi:four helix bundle protein